MIKNKIYVGMANSRSIKFIGIFDRLENDNYTHFRDVIYLSDNTYVYDRDMVFPYYLYNNRCLLSRKEIIDLNAYLY